MTVALFMGIRKVSIDLLGFLAERWEDEHGGGTWWKWLDQHKTTILLEGNAFLWFCAKDIIRRRVLEYEGVWLWE